MAARRPPAANAIKPLHGFTLVELLMANALFGIVIALLVPAAQAARESPHRAQCANGLKPAGRAAVNIQSDRKSFCREGTNIGPTRDRARFSPAGPWYLFAMIFTWMWFRFDTEDCASSQSDAPSRCKRPIAAAGRDDERGSPVADSAEKTLTCQTR
jgi:prepilin-type N-terminal cleavage/methylation domain-containing protein